MIPKKTFKYCEYCHKAWEDTSPSTEEEYENGLIEIKEGVMLLPKEFRIHKKGYPESCAVFFDGVFCNADCLYQFLKNKLKAKK
jgi:hypothetical protein